MRPEFARAMQRGEVLTPVEVLQTNMEFYHEQAGQLLATIMDLPTLTRDEQTDAQVRALLLLAEHLRMREKAGEAAAVLARYVHRPMAPKPYDKREEEPAPDKSGPILGVIPTHPAITAAFARAAAGLPPEPRKAF